MSVTIANVNLALVAQEALRGLMAGVPALRAVASDFSADIPSGLTVQVPIVGSTSANTFTPASSTYEASSLSIGGTTVVLNENYVKLTLNHLALRGTGSEQSIVRAIGRAGSEAVARKAWADLCGLVSSTSFAGSVISAATAFDFETLAGLSARQSEGRVMLEGRYAVLAPKHYAALVSDSAVIPGGVIRGTEESFRSLQVPRAAGYDVYMASDFAGATEVGQNLVGWVATPDALAVASRILTPPVAPGEGYESEVATDPETGLSIEVRRWFEQGTGQAVVWIGHAFGVARGVQTADALIRIRSA